MIDNVVLNRKLLSGFGKTKEEMKVQQCRGRSSKIQLIIKEKTPRCRVFSAVAMGGVPY
jgi:hypothetical protein